MKITFEGARAYRANRALTRLSLWVAVAGTILAVASFELPGLVEFGAVLMLAGWASFAALSNGLLPVKSREPLAAAREGLYEGERLIVLRERVRGGLPVQRALPAVEGGPALVLLEGSGPVLVHVDTLETARRLQEVLQLDAEHRRTEVMYRKPMGLAVVAVVALSMLLFVLLGTVVVESGWVVTLALAPMFALAFWRIMLTIGDDGVSVRTLGYERFMAYSDISSVDAVEAADPARRLALRIALRSGKEVKLDGAPALQSHTGVQIDEAVLERTQGALQRYRDRAGRAPVLPLSLSVQSTGSPLERVRALLRKEHGGDAYRQNAADEDALRRAVDEPTLPPRVRAEAAIALGASRDADDLERIRRAAERSACHPLRELFDEVAEGVGEDRLARALRRVG